jgi:hypothetical protein
MVPARPTKISFAEMREQGVRGLLMYCADYTCSHSTAISGDRWPDDARLSDIEPRFVCTVCGKRGADVRPDFNWNKGAGQCDGLPMKFAADQRRYSQSMIELRPGTAGELEFGASLPSSSRQSTSSRKRGGTSAASRDSKARRRSPISRRIA